MSETMYWSRSPTSQEGAARLIEPLRGREMSAMTVRSLGSAMLCWNREDVLTVDSSVVERVHARCMIPAPAGVSCCFRLYLLPRKLTRRG